jgi:regulator of replication initiation timing
MNSLITKVIVEVGRTLGKAVVAGLGVELARLASAHLRKRLGPRDAEEERPVAADDAELKSDISAVKEENARLRAEVDRLREELGAGRPGP